MHRLGTVCSGVYLYKLVCRHRYAVYPTFSASTCRIQLALNACHADPCCGAQYANRCAAIAVHMMHALRYTSSNSLDLKHFCSSGVGMREQAAYIYAACLMVCTLPDKSFLPQQQCLLGRKRGDKHGTVFHCLVLVLHTGCQEAYLMEWVCWAR